MKQNRREFIKSSSVLFGCISVFGFNNTILPAKNTPLKITGISSQTSDLVQWQSSKGKVLAGITSDGKFYQMPVEI